MASDAAVVAGTSPMPVQWFCTGTPSTNDHRKRGRVVELEPGPGVADRRADLGPVAHDARIGEAAGDVVVVERGDPHRVEAGEAAGVALALVQDRRPRQAGLGALEEHELEQPAGIALRARPTRCRGRRRTAGCPRPSCSAVVPSSSVTAACTPRPRPRRPCRRAAPTPRPSSGPGGGRRRRRRRPR